jgi:hypothetical protein
MVMAHEEATALLSIVILVLFLLITLLGKRLISSRAAGVFADVVKALQAGGRSKQSSAIVRSCRSTWLKPSPSSKRLSAEVASKI